MKGININDKTFPFTELILEGMKTIETREGTSLSSVIGQRVGIIRTGRGPATLVGYVDVTGVIEYDRETFRKDYGRHLVEEGSLYDIKEKKFGYILANPVRCTPTPVTARGIVIRNI